MRLAVISDIHANLAALEAVLADIRGRSVDASINLGDCVAGPLWPRETMELLEAEGLPTVRGNHDRYMFEGNVGKLPPSDIFARAALSAAQCQALFDLPHTIDVSPEILAVHGTPLEDQTFLTEDVPNGRMVPATREQIAARLGPAASRAVVLCGHSHRQNVLQQPGGPLIVNPGTVGCPVFADIATANGFEPRSPHARYAILTRRHNRWGVEQFALDYDWDAAAAKAVQNGFPRWAEALTTGSVTR